MTGGKAIIHERNIDANKTWGRTWTPNIITNERIEAIPNPHRQQEKDPLSIPAQENHSSEQDPDGDTRRRRVVEHAYKVKQGGYPW